MRNAAAHFDDDFGLTEPTRKKPAPLRTAPGKKKGKGKAKRFRFNMSMNAVARYAAIGMSATVVLGILVNALMMQQGHHPAPLFGTSIALGTPAKPAPKPVARVEARTPPDAATTIESTPPMPAAKPHAMAKADTSGDTDAIARLLTGGGAPATADKADKTETKTVLGAQRALAKLGFTVKATGTFGPQTKKAIESFEKDRHLAVKGELSRRVIKILAAESGIKIEH